MKTRLVGKANLIAFLMLIWGVSFLFNSCADEGEEPDPNPTPTDITRNYLASGSYGDVIRYELNETDKIVKYFNETTGKSGSGSYTLTSNSNIDGVYEVVFDGKTYHAIELSEKMFATSAPSGRNENSLCFGLSADLDFKKDYSMSDLAGKYMFVLYDDMEDDSIYGGYELFANGTYTWKFGPDDENAFDESKHFAGSGSGTWSINDTDPSRLNFVEDGETYTGTVLPGKAMLIDNGEGGGFVVGLSYPSVHATQAEVAGEYRAIDITLEGETGIGTYTIPATGGNLSYYFSYDGTSGVDQGVADNFAPVPNMNNVFKASAVYDNEEFTAYFIMFPGEILLHFTVGEKAGLIDYGVGAVIK